MINLLSEGFQYGRKCSFPLVFNTDGGAPGLLLAGSEDRDESAWRPHAGVRPVAQGDLPPLPGPGRAGRCDRLSAELNLRSKDGQRLFPRLLARGPGSSGRASGGETERMKCIGS